MAQGFTIASYGEAVEAFNRDDRGPLSELLATDCTFEASMGPLGRSREEILASLARLRTEVGWTAHVLLSMAVAGDFAVTLFRNEFADGTSHIGGGVFRVDSNGQVCEIRTLEPPLPQS